MSIIANNRFLQPVNKQIVRGLADAGANFVGNGHVLHPLFRQMVDLGISGNLKLWVHRNLVETRASGGDTFVPTAYDLSSNNNDGVQATTGYQPKLVSLGLEFDGSDDSLDCGGESSLYFGTGDFSFSVWFYADVDAKTHDIISNRALGAVYSSVGFIFGSTGATDVGRLAFVLDNGIDAAKNYYLLDLYEISTWYHFAGTWKNSTDTMLLYKNGSDITSSLTKASDDSLTGESITSTSNFTIANRPGTTGRCWDGILNDIRIFNTALTETQITAIYNTTKSFYGL